MSIFQLQQWLEYLALSTLTIAQRVPRRGFAKKTKRSTTVAPCRSRRDKINESFTIRFVILHFISPISEIPTRFTVFFSNIVQIVVSFVNLQMIAQFVSKDILYLLTHVS